MGNVRVDRMQEFIKQELSQIVLQEMKDPRIGFITVTKVIVSGDLRIATVFISVLGDTEKRKTTIKALEKAAGFLRSELARRMKVRFAPQLLIKLDENLDYSLHVNKLLEGVVVETTEEEAEGGFSKD